MKKKIPVTSGNRKWEYGDTCCLVRGCQKVSITSENIHLEVSPPLSGLGNVNVASHKNPRRSIIGKRGWLLFIGVNGELASLHCLTPHLVIMFFVNVRPIICPTIAHKFFCTHYFFPVLALCSVSWTLEIRLHFTNSDCTFIDEFVLGWARSVAVAEFQRRNSMCLLNGK